MYILVGNKEINPEYYLDFDGGALNNPGPCAGAFVIYNNHEIVAEGGKYIEHGTNNIGEYTGLLRGLEQCLEMGIKSISIKGDSKLVVSQVAKIWKINNLELNRLQQQIWNLIPKFEMVKIRHVLRKENKIADMVSDETLDKKYSWVRFSN
jgi:probable phosphoglycerate mutase